MTEIPAQRQSIEDAIDPFPSYNLLVANERPTMQRLRLEIATLMGDFARSEGRWMAPHYIAPKEFNAIKHAMRKYDPSGNDVYRDPFTHRIPELQTAVVRTLELSRVAINGVLLLDHVCKNTPCIGEVVNDIVNDHYKHADSNIKNFGVFYHDSQDSTVTRLEQRRDDAEHSDVGNTVQQWSLKKA